MKDEALLAPNVIACLGECMIELSGQAFGQVKQSFGGDTYNTAVYLRRLLPDSTSVYYLTALGEDSLSLHMKQAWATDAGIKTDFVFNRAGKAPGLYQITVNNEGERSFTYWRNDAAAKYVFDDLSVTEIEQLLANFGTLYLSGISLAILTEKGRGKLLDALPNYKAAGGRIIFDNNYRPILWPDKDISQQTYQAVMVLADIALLTLDDEQSHFGFDCAEEVLAHWKCPEIVVKRGAEPCMVRFENIIYEVAGPVVEQVVDTTAAGDSFAAGYVAGRMVGLAPAQSAKQGHQVATRVIQHPGAIVPLSVTNDLTNEEFA